MGVWWHMVSHDSSTSYIYCTFSGSHHMMCIQAFGEPRGWQCMMSCPYMESSRAPGKLSHIQIGHVQIPLSLQKVPTESVKGPRESDDWDHMNQKGIFAMAACARLIRLKPSCCFFWPLRQCDFASILAQEEMSTKTSPPPTMIKKAWRETWSLDQGQILRWS